MHTDQFTALFREPLRNLLPRLNNRVFVQINRNAIVNLEKVAVVVTQDRGNIALKLNGIDKMPVVSRVFRHLFKPM